MKGNNLTTLIHRVIDFLEIHEITYVLIGGIAVDIWGLPRMTNDIDVVIATSPRQYNNFVGEVLQAGFVGDIKKIRNQLKKMGMCRLFYRNRHVDFIMGYSTFEKEIFLRKKRVELLKRKVYVASPEDIILYKLLSAREIDFADIKNIVITQAKRLDLLYLRSQAARMQSELYRSDISTNLEKYIGTIRNI